MINICFAINTRDTVRVTAKPPPLASQSLPVHRSVGRGRGDRADPHGEGAHENEAVLEDDGGARPRRLLEVVVHVRVREHEYRAHEGRHGQRHAEHHEAPAA
ncbi:hypothetical protein ON010_g8607 [Phytophthora cinnamomi]|nr:hypothetical protein ON010_g8607 [Phytophthora cinnamomi]